MTLRKVKDADELQKILRSTGAKASVSPGWEAADDESLGDPFEISIDRFRGNADVIEATFPANGGSVYVSEVSRGQLVLRLNEPHHEFVWENTISNLFNLTSKKKEQVEAFKNFIIQRAQNWTALPEGTTIKDLRITRSTFSLEEYRPMNSYTLKELEGYNSWRVNVKFDVPEQKTSFLIGIDEDKKHPFISVLPNNNANSVEAAHKSLRPRNVPKGSLRQGEWFFVPVTKKERTWIAENIAEKIGNTYDSIYIHLGGSAEDEPDHAADLLIMNDDGEEFVFGKIVNSRHKTLLLTDWHKAVRNLEIETNRFANYD